MQRTPRKALGTCTVIALSGLLIAGLGWTALDMRQVTAKAADSAQAYTPPVTYTAPPEPVKVAFLGDSFTVGTGSEQKFDRWSSLLARDMAWVELNYGYGGTNFGTAGTLKGGRSYADRLTDLVLSDPDIVIVSSAGNTLNQDQKHGITETFAQLGDELPDARIIALSPMSRAGEYRKELVKFGRDIESAVEDVGGEYVDIGHPLQNHPKAMDDDGVHPNDAGHQLIADAVEDAL